MRPRCGHPRGVPPPGRAPGMQSLIPASDGSSPWPPSKCTADQRRENQRDRGDHDHGQYERAPRHNRPHCNTEIAQSARTRGPVYETRPSREVTPLARNRANESPTLLGIITLWRAPTRRRRPHRSAPAARAWSPRSRASGPGRKARALPSPVQAQLDRQLLQRLRQPIVLRQRSLELDLLRGGHPPRL